MTTRPLSSIDLIDSRVVCKFQCPNVLAHHSLQICSCPDVQLAPLEKSKYTPIALTSMDSFACSDMYHSNGNNNTQQQKNTPKPSVTRPPPTSRLSLFETPQPYNKTELSANRPHKNNTSFNTKKLLKNTNQNKNENKHDDTNHLIQVDEIFVQNTENDMLFDENIISFSSNNTNNYNKDSNNDKKSTENTFLLSPTSSFSFLHTQNPLIKINHNNSHLNTINHINPQRYQHVSRPQSRNLQHNIINTDVTTTNSTTRHTQTITQTTQSHNTSANGSKQSFERSAHIPIASTLPILPLPTIPSKNRSNGTMSTPTITVSNNTNTNIDSNNNNNTAKFSSQTPHSSAEKSPANQFNKSNVGFESNNGNVALVSDDISPLKKNGASVVNNNNSYVITTSPNKDNFFAINVNTSINNTSLTVTEIGSTCSTFVSNSNFNSHNNNSFNGSFHSSVQQHQHGQQHCQQSEDVDDTYHVVIDGTNDMINTQHRNSYSRLSNLSPQVDLSNSDMFRPQSEQSDNDDCFLNDFFQLFDIKNFDNVDQNNINSSPQGSSHETDNDSDNEYKTLTRNHDFDGVYQQKTHKLNQNNQNERSKTPKANKYTHSTPKPPNAVATNSFKTPFHKTYSRNHRATIQFDGYNDEIEQNNDQKNSTNNNNIHSQATNLAQGFSTPFPTDTSKQTRRICPPAPYPYANTGIINSRNTNGNDQSSNQGAPLAQKNQNSGGVVDGKLNGDEIYHQNTSTTQNAQLQTPPLQHNISTPRYVYDAFSPFKSVPISHRIINDIYRHEQKQEQKQESVVQNNTKQQSVQQSQQTFKTPLVKRASVELVDNLMGQGVQPTGSGVLKNNGNPYNNNNNNNNNKNNRPVLHLGKENNNNTLTNTRPQDEFHTPQRHYRPKVVHRSLLSGASGFANPGLLLKQLQHENNKNDTNDKNSTFSTTVTTLNKSTNPTTTATTTSSSSIASIPKLNESHSHYHNNVLQNFFKNGRLNLVSVGQVYQEKDDEAPTFRRRSFRYKCKRHLLTTDESSSFSRAYLLGSPIPISSTYPINTSNVNTTSSTLVQQTISTTTVSQLGNNNYNNDLSAHSTSNYDSYDESSSSNSSDHHPVRQLFTKYSPVICSDHLSSQINGEDLDVILNLFTHNNDAKRSTQLNIELGNELEFCQSEQNTPNLVTTTLTPTNSTITTTTHPTNSPFRYTSLVSNSFDHPHDHHGFSDIDTDMTNRINMVPNPVNNNNTTQTSSSATCIPVRPSLGENYRQNFNNDDILGFDGCEVDQSNLVTRNNYSTFLASSNNNNNSKTNAPLEPKLHLPHHRRQTGPRRLILESDHDS